MAWPRLWNRKPLVKPPEIPIQCEACRLRSNPNIIGTFVCDTRTEKFDITSFRRYGMVTEFYVLPQAGEFIASCFTEKFWRCSPIVAQNGITRIHGLNNTEYYIASSSMRINELGRLTIVLRCFPEEHPADMDEYGVVVDRPYDDLVPEEDPFEARRREKVASDHNHRLLKKHLDFVFDDVL